MSTWLALLIAVACAAVLWVRLALLMPTWKLRRRVSIGLAVGALVGLAQSAIKHTSQPWGLLLIADGYFAMLMSLIGAGEDIRNAAVQSISGSTQNVPQKVANRIVIVVLAAGVSSIIVEALFLRRS